MEDNNKITPTEEVEKKDEVVEEEKVAPEAEVKEVETKEVLPEAVQKGTVVNPVPLFEEKMKTVENFDEYAEGKRQSFYKDFHKVKVVSYILMALSLAFVVALFVLVFAIKEDSLKWIIYVDLGLCFACLVTNFIYSKISVSKSEKRFKEYVFNFLHELQDACYKDTAIENATFDGEGKIENEKIYNAHIYSTINRIESRCVVKGSLFNRNFTSADVAVVIPSAGYALAANKKNAQEVFALYGRAIEFDYKFNDGGIIIVRKGEKTAMPNHTVGYQEVSIPGLENFIVYATDVNVANNFFNVELVEKIKSIELNEDLLDYMISLNDKGTFIYANYSDNYMVVPTSKAHPENTYARVIADNHKFISVLELLK